MTNLLNSIEKKKKKELYKNSLNLISCPYPPTKELKNNNKKKSGLTCKDQIWLESRIEMDLGPGSPNNEFADCGRES